MRLCASLMRRNLCLPCVHTSHHHTASTTHSVYITIRVTTHPVTPFPLVIIRSAHAQCLLTLPSACWHCLKHRGSLCSLSPYSIRNIYSYIMVISLFICHIRLESMALIVTVSRISKNMRSHEGISLEK